MRVVRLDDGSHVGHTAIRELDGVAVEDGMVGVRFREVAIDNTEKLPPDLSLDGQTEGGIEKYRLPSSAPLLGMLVVRCRVGEMVVFVATLLEGVLVVRLVPVERGLVLRQGCDSPLYHLRYCSLYV